MRTQFILATLIMTAALTFGHHEAQAFISAQISAPSVSVSINGFLPAPPGVHVLIDAGRPYYIEREQRVYIEREPAHHHKKEKKHNHGEHNGHH